MVESVKNKDYSFLKGLASDLQCSVCKDILIYPVLTECGHQICRFCLTTSHNKNTTNFKNKDKEYKANCPVCQQEIQSRYNYSKDINEKIFQDIYQRINQEASLKEQQVHQLAGIYEVELQTINNFDKNKTSSETCFFVVDNELNVFGDIAWGGGSQHNTYYQCISRAEGQIQNYQKDQDKYNVRYSNGPTEDWELKMEIQDIASLNMFSVGGSYIWYGWNNRKTSGMLKGNMRKINIYRVSSSEE